MDKSADSNYTHGMNPETIEPRPGVIQIKTRALWTAALVAGGIIILVGLIALAAHFLGSARRLEFKASVDGVDILKISHARLWLEHQDFQKPTGLAVNGMKWNPVWDGNTSAACQLSHGFHPRSAAAINITTHKGRGEIVLMEMPSATNDETLTIKIDDGPYDGAGWYDFTVSW